MVTGTEQKETGEKRADALRAELTEEYMKVTREVMARFGISGHYSLEFVITLIEP